MYYLGENRGALWNRENTRLRSSQGKFHVMYVTTIFKKAKFKKKKKKQSSRDLQVVALPLTTVSPQNDP